MSMQPQGILPPLGEAPIDGGYRQIDTDWIWGGSVIKGDDGRFYMYASIFSTQYPFGDWCTQSRIVLAVSGTAEGPYSYLQEVLPRRGGNFWDGLMTTNPTIHRYSDQYVLFYTGTMGDATTSRYNQRVGYATAPSPTGPWTRLDQPCISPNPNGWDKTFTANPAACILEDGRILLLYKSSTDGSLLQYGVTMAAGLGKPFKPPLNGGDPIVFKNGDGSAASYEDAYVWLDNGKFRMIFKDIGGGLMGQAGGGAGAVSSDGGISWKLYDPPLAYRRSVSWSDRTTTLQEARERPQLLIQSGVLTHLFTATAGTCAGSSTTCRFCMVDPFQT